MCRLRAKRKGHGTLCWKVTILPRFRRNWPHISTSLKLSGTSSKQGATPPSWTSRCGRWHGKGGNFPANWGPLAHWQTMNRFKCTEGSAQLHEFNINMERRSNSIYSTLLRRSVKDIQTVVSFRRIPPSALCNSRTRPVEAGPMGLARVRLGPAQLKQLAIHFKHGLVQLVFGHHARASRFHRTWNPSP